MRKFTKKTLAVTSVAVLLGSGAAYAYWTTTGSGTATSTTAASLATLTTTQNGSVTAMSPGSAVQDVDFTVNNSAASPQYVTTIAMSITTIKWTSAAGAGTGVTQADHPALATATGCSSSDFTLTQPVAGVDIPTAGLAFTQATTPRKSGRIVMINSGSNQDACKGTTVALAFALT